MKKPLFITLFILVLMIIVLKYSATKKSINSSNAIPVVDNSNVNSSTIDNNLSNANTFDSLGIWEISNYVNEFNEITKEKYIRMKDDISGTFSNSATQNSELTVRFLINGNKNVNIMLFEYAGNNPVKEGVEENYKVRIKHNDDNPITLYANNYSDRLSFDKKSSAKITDIFKQGGSVSFFIIENSQYSISQYQFKIEDCTGFDKIIKLFNKK
jgi:hypothetical protein